MLRGIAGPVQETQRQPACKPFGLRERTARGLPVPGGDGVGPAEQAALYRLADLVALLGPPFAGADQFRRPVEEQFARARILAGEPAPAYALEHEARMAAQAVRHLPDRPVHAAPALHQPEPRFSQPAFRLAGMAELAARGPGALVPEQPVQPAVMVICAERVAVPPEKAALQVAGEVAVNPGFAQEPHAGVRFPVRDQGFRQALLAGAGERRKPGEPGARGAVRIGLGHLFLGPPEKGGAVRPVRMRFKERLDFGEGYDGFRAPEALPLDQGGGQGMSGPLRAPGSLPPLAARGGIERRPEVPPSGTVQNAIRNFPRRVGFARHGRRRRVRGRRRACGGKRQGAAGQRRPDSRPDKTPSHSPNPFCCRAAPARIVHGMPDTAYRGSAKGICCETRLKEGPVTAAGGRGARS